MNNQNDQWLKLLGQLLASGAAGAFWLAVLIMLIASSA